MSTERGFARLRAGRLAANRLLAAACLAAIAAGTAIAGDEAAHDSRHQCTPMNISISAADPADAKDACEGASAAVGFFEDAGLRTDAPVRIDVTDTIPEQASPTAAGCFLEKEGRIVVASYGKFRREKTWFDVPVTRKMYRSLAAHEMGHALASCNFSVPNPAIRAKEYVAYVTMFATMEPGLRRHILKNYAEEEASSERHVTEMLLMFDPMRFGARAYLHYSRPENGIAFLRAVFEGKALQD